MDFLSTLEGQTFRHQLVKLLKDVTKELNQSNSSKPNELALKERELALKEKELRLKERELNGNVPIPSLLDHKSSLLLVTVPDDDLLHQSWLLDGGLVVSYEVLPDYPGGSLMLTKSVAEYIEAIKDVSWINDPAYIHRHNLSEYGFPFAIEDDE